MLGDKFTLAITVLLTGFAVVFAVLLLLIGIIKLYGTVIYRLQNRKPKDKPTAPDLPKAVRDPEPVPTVTIEAGEENEDELIAVISAAVYSVYSSSQVRIKSIRKTSAKSNAWRSAGLADHIRPF